MSLSGDPVIILGSYRSGTSVVASTLVEMGLYMGSKDALFPADEFNPDGHWELKEMMSLHERLLMAFRSNYFAAPYLPENWHEHPLRENMVRDTGILLEKHFHSHAAWGWKEPATSILMPLYKEALAAQGLKGRYVICVRHPKAVVASMKKRFVATPMETMNSATGDLNGVDERLMTMWVAYTLSSLRESRGATRFLLSYERFLQDPKSYVEAIGSRLLPWKPTTEQMAAAAQIVKPSLSHTKLVPEEQMEAWPEIINKVQRLCLRADADPDGFQSGDYDQQVEDLWTEWIRTRRMILPIVLPAGEMNFSWIASGKEKHFSEGYIPTEEGDLLQFNIDAPPNTLVKIDPYPIPCQMWIRSAHWVSATGEEQAILQAGETGILEEISGAQRLTVFGPSSLVCTTPARPGTYQFKIDLLLQMDQAAMTRIVANLARRVSKI